MAPAAETGALTPEENERIFRREILPDYLPAPMGQAEAPHLILLGGQPGVGKTSLLIASATELGEGGPTVRIVGDDLRSYHPAFLAYQAADAETASRLTQIDAGIWAERLYRAALERRVNIVFESTIRNPENVARVLISGRDADYQVEGRVIASNPRASWQGCHYRFEEMIVAGAAARMPPREIHDAAVAGLQASLERIEREQLADRVQIRLRNGEIVYSNELVDGRWSRSADAGEELGKARDRPLTRREMDAFVDRWAMVLQRMEDRKARQDLIDAVGAQSRDDVAWFVMLRDRMNSGQSAIEDRNLAPGVQPIKAPGRVVAVGAGQGEVGVAPRSGVARQILIPGRELPDLTSSEIEEKLKQSSRLAEKRAEIERLAVLVYGNSQQLATSVQAIDGAAGGSSVAADVRSGKVGPLAGEDRSFFRPETPERQTAKAYLPQLAAAVEDYGRTVDFARHQIDIAHRAEQHRQRQEIRIPSPDLSAALRAPAQEQGERFQAKPHLRAELDKFSAAVRRRLNVDERRALNHSDAPALSRGLNVPEIRAVALVETHRQVQAASRQIQVQRQQLDRNAALSMKR